MTISPLLQLMSPMTNRSMSSSIHSSSFVSAFQNFLDEELTTNHADSYDSKPPESLFLHPEAASQYFQTSSGTNQADMHTDQQFSVDENEFASLIESTGHKYGVDPRLIHAVIKQESGFDPNAKSHAGAMGLMQLMPGTARYLNVEDPYNPSQNIEGGTRYLKDMLERFNRDTSLALAAYNAGPGSVERFNGIPPFKETQNYVPAVMNTYQALI
ncbi:lytic transglycosylase domain-containing protein [Alteribacillus bidgolensis]|uniref:Transglycosylase SLT domain-containing protein n=1 Tax=Alteribacillus bidgolensis TaxID=930129 RepID=A0A1G8J726_9BACI|nr:lytic transglycosylase domain-containing protein [Alteribacillus bidgolensis]SDI26986.1 Transglycosylase SLT domain-containing protein [Alteribacillus bidgolensis]